MYRFLISSLAVLLLGSSLLWAETNAAQVAWRLLDYIAVDYPGAVSQGKVISETEFAEMNEFAQSAEDRIKELPQTKAQDDLLEQAKALQKLISEKTPTTTVAKAARDLASNLLKHYPVPLAPNIAPNVRRGKQLYRLHCTSCHGDQGNGLGEAAAGLEPPPIDFTDHDRASERSIFAYYQVIEQGLEDTAMMSYAAMPSADRWDMAMYIGTFAFPEKLVKDGKRLWEGSEALRESFNLEKLVGTTPASLAEDLGESEALALTAYLRRSPSVVVEQMSGTLTIARKQLAEALEAYRQNNVKGATAKALSAYLDGFEPIEPVLATHDNALLIRIEGAMAKIRSDIARGRSIDEVEAQIRILDGLFEDVEGVLASGGSSLWAGFIGAFTILLREGLEALLIVVAMITFLRKVGRTDVLPHVHAGWIVALIAGILTWIAATYFIQISGASRELTEGFGSVFAAFVLLWVGLWMHGKSSAEAWQHYIEGKLQRALNRRSAWLLFGLSFLVVYREVFETILFYAAIWNHGNSFAVLTGGILAGLVLCFLAWMLTRLGKSLPMEKFFSYSSLLIAVLAVVLIGKGVAALQEAGYLSIHPLAGWPRWALLGIYPTLEGMVATLGMILLLGTGSIWNRMSLRKAMKS